MYLIWLKYVEPIGTECRPELDFLSKQKYFPKVIFNSEVELISKC